MTKNQKARIKRMNELWTRLVERGKNDERAALSLNEWKQLVNQFKLDVGISEHTLWDYLNTLRGLGAWWDNWDYAVQKSFEQDISVERIVRYYVNLGFKMPSDTKEY